MLSPILWFKLKSIDFRNINSCEQTQWIFWTIVFTLFAIIATMIVFCCGDSSKTQNESRTPQDILDSGWRINYKRGRLIKFVVFFILYWFILMPLLWVHLQSHDGIDDCGGGVHNELWFSYAFWTWTMIVFIIIASLVFCVNCCCCYRQTKIIEKNNAIDNRTTPKSFLLPDFDYTEENPLPHYHNLKTNIDHPSSPRYRFFDRYPSMCSADYSDDCSSPPPPPLPMRKLQNRPVHCIEMMEHIPLGSPLYPTSPTLKSEVFVYVIDVADAESTNVDKYF